MAAPATGPDGAALPAHARRRLADPRWRRRKVWWILPSLLTFGVLGSVGFFWAGAKTLKPKYFVSAVAWLLMAIAVPVSANVVQEGPVTGVLATVCAFGPAIQSVIMHRTYLVERAIAD